MMGLAVSTVRRFISESAMANFAIEHTELPDPLKIVRRWTICQNKNSPEYEGVVFGELTIDIIFAHFNECEKCKFWLNKLVLAKRRKAALKEIKNTCGDSGGGTGW